MAFPLTRCLAGSFHFSEGKSGAPGGIRTHDQLIKSQLLYQLSYRGNMFIYNYLRVKFSS